MITDNDASPVIHEYDAIEMETHTTGLYEPISSAIKSMEDGAILTNKSAVQSIAEVN